MVAATLLNRDEDVRHVGHEVDDATARGRQLCLGEKDADQETEHGSGNSCQRQEDEDDVGVAVGKYFTSLCCQRKTIM